MIPDLFLATITVLALNTQFNMGSESGLWMNCPSIPYGQATQTSCLVNVTKLVEQGCYNDDYIFVIENTSDHTDIVTACHISRHTGRCLKSPICPHCSRSNGQTTIHFQHLRFDGLERSCSAYCPNNRRLTSPNICWLNRPFPAYATNEAVFGDDFTVERYALMMMCPWDIPQLPFKIECLVNVTKLVDQGCMTSHGYLRISTKFEGLFHDPLSYCEINLSSFRCTESHTCPICKAHSPHLVSTGFIATELHAQYTNFTVRCTAVCGSRELKSDSVCDVKYT